MKLDVTEEDTDMKVDDIKDLKREEYKGLKLVEHQEQWLKEKISRKLQRDESLYDTESVLVIDVAADVQRGGKTEYASALPYVANYSDPFGHTGELFM